MIRGLYAITAETPDTARLVAQVRAALEGGCRLVQYRDKSVDAPRRSEQAHELRLLTQHFGAKLFVNDDIPLAKEVDADGVHCGRDEVAAFGSVADCVAHCHRLDLKVGVSCYDSLALAEAAVCAGADYIAFGAAFPSPTKPQAVHAPLSLYREARSRWNAPIVAIGGIRLENAHSLIDAGVDALAVISDLWGGPNTADRARAFSELLTTTA